jgi:hypothetical protein
MEPLNLARRPFLNSRPVVRVSLILWLLGLVLLLGNVSLFRRYLHSSADKRQEIARGERDIERQQRVAGELETRLESIDLESLNEQVDFLNEKIDRRTFSWSLLLDRLAEVLPDDVRLNRLTPTTGEKAQRQLRSSRRERGGPEGGILLTITGESRSWDALLQFVDQLFAHPFRDPDLKREQLEEKDGLVKFELSVVYLPDDRPRAAVTGEAPTIEEVPSPGSAAGTAAPQATPGTTVPPRAPALGGRP